MSETRSVDIKQADRLPEAGAGFRWETGGQAPALVPSSPGIRAVFTTRLGGVSGGPFESLNLAADLSDDPGRVQSNRERAGALIGAGADWSHPRQVHGTEVVRAFGPEARPDADAVWTDAPGECIAVLVADCVPVLLVGEGVVAVVHAGWRGLAAGVVERAADAIGAHTAWSGPAIGPCCYEIGPEVERAFRDRFGGGVLPEARRADLWRAAEEAATKAGAGEVHSCRLCTACHPQLFFSHRRSGGTAGRQGLLAMRP